MQFCLPHRSLSALSTLSNLHIREWTSTLSRTFLILLYLGTQALILA